VPTLEGATIIRIPPGTPGSKVFRLAGRGLPAMKGGRRGDLHIKVHIEVPAALSSAQRERLEALSAELGADAHPERQAYDEQIAARS
jgi:molecular chaperone DnaJ